MPGPVMLGYVHAGSSASFGIRPEFLTSVLSVLMDEQAGALVGSVDCTSAGALVAVARNMLTARFLDSGLEWLWCVDTDMIFGPQTLLGLYSVSNPARRPVVGALCHILDSEHGAMPAVYRAVDDGGELVFERYPSNPGGVVQVAAVGAACVLIHRGVFEKIQADQGGQAVWWNHVTAGGTMLGEDLSFCMRAGVAGIPVWVHGGIQAGHVKPVVIGDVVPGPVTS